MSTAYRVWDGEQMYYSYDDELTMIIEPSGAWEVFKCGINRGETIANSHDGKSVLMWGIEFFDSGIIYQADIIKGKRESTWHPGYDKVLGKVEFSKDTHGFYVEGMGAGPLYNIEPNFELLGDVYQNPELLEGVE
ncbi:YopX family protein [Bacillus inaquosorum]|uniref:YopX family protein n=1 Tax=Bacillus inaquosorum TaxID=483913 RepID=UPI00227EA124|nr:YopX family protein [Bacillus inaquosorum]MCY8081750.1 YopX family protein [Bacillus inaquosorum]MCY8704983.1 YopX family protein [Bacillus inaquosorum]